MRPVKGFPCRPVTAVFSCTVFGLVALLSSPQLRADCDAGDDSRPECLPLEVITIFGKAEDVRDVAGGASVVSHEDLEEFETTDVVRALRRVPGVSLQQEDGFGLRPNISIRGTATDRSSRVTLMEDGVLIAPAPYSAPAAYYFPTFGRIHAIEVLKGPAAISQGPYTVGGAINLLSTPVPQDSGGEVQGEYGSDNTWRAHGWYRGGGEQAAFLVETHQWRSDGYQHIDRSEGDTGLEKEDYVAKLQFTTAPDARFRQSVELKLEASEEDSRQSYLGLADTDFEQDPLRRYGLSEQDAINTDHEQIMVRWRIEGQSGNGLTLTAYRNDFFRAWYKTEGMDFDGSANPESFQRTSWAAVVTAVNEGRELGGFTADELQAVLDGADTAPGSVQLRNNARDYYSRGIQLTADRVVETGAVLHQLEIGLRYHEDQEDRLQRNDNFQQLNGELVLNALGLEGNAGNQVQEARAWATYLQDRIEVGGWTFTPGLRYENIDLSRVRYLTIGSQASRRGPEDVRDRRTNNIDVWLPGVGVTYALNDSTRLIAGVHKGFATPTNEPGVDPEKSINYEFGLRHTTERLGFEALFFFNDYENLVGVCTNSTGSDCEAGQAFNGNGVQVPGLELAFDTAFDIGGGWEVPLELTYTWMNAEFQSNFDSDFFGVVNKGDPVPYVTDHQLRGSLGLRQGRWSASLSANYLDSVCTQASCERFERTESAVIFDLSAHFEVNRHWTLYAVAENLADEQHIAGREPYGARPGKARTVLVGARLGF